MSQSLDLLYESIAECRRCPLHIHRTRVVPGSGPADASVMFIGEGPGPDEDVQGLPFIGKAGKVLRGVISEVGISFDDVYFANLVKCYPTDGEPNQRGYLQFRQPKLDEVEECDPFLKAQIDIVRPKVVIPLGAVATNQWFPGTTIGQIHGVLRHNGQYLVAPTYHPSAAARGATHLRELMVVDIRRAVEYVGLLDNKGSVSGL